MKNLFFLWLIIGVGQLVHAQDASLPQTPRHKLAIFTPLYLDEAFDAAGSYRFSGKSFPKNSLPGLEFYHGAQIAIDSLNSQNIPLDVFVYDSKSTKETLENQFSKAANDGVELIVANFSIADVTKYAKLAAEKKITVLNVNVPNDGNAQKNPYFVVMNPTLQTQAESIFSYIKSNYASRPVVFLTRKGNAEDYIKSVFVAWNSQKDSTPLKISYVDAVDTLSVSKAINSLPKNQNPVFVVGALDAHFSTTQLKYLSTVGKRNSQGITTVIGMPTWESIPLAKEEYKGLEVIYSTPFYNSGNNHFVKNINDYYSKKMYAKPSDLLYRAFGVTLRFGQLLNFYGKELNANLGDKRFNVIYDYDIQPVFNNHFINYFENKRLYFLKFYNGNLQNVN